MKVVTGAATAAGSYTHAHCGRCETLLYCSEVKEWDHYGIPGTRVGFCPHDETGVTVAATFPAMAGDEHMCGDSVRPNGVAK